MKGRNSVKEVEREFSPSFKVIGSHLPWTTQCDGMPSPAGCGNSIETSVPYVRPGAKSTDWLLCYPVEERGKEDKSFLLAFCPTCSEIVKGQS